MPSSTKTRNRPRATSTLPEILQQHQQLLSSYLRASMLLSLLLVSSARVGGRSKRWNGAKPSPFKIIIDGGSTGSRLHVFEFVEENENAAQAKDRNAVGAQETGVESDESDDRGTGPALPQQEDELKHEQRSALVCHRRGSTRVDMPLSAFGRVAGSALLPPLNRTAVAHHILPLLEYAATIIPPRYHADTRVQYQATAGMRLLSESEQEAVYDAMYEGLLETDQPFALYRKDIATLSGELEGFYGAVAANYLHGIIDADMTIQSREEGDRNATAQERLEEYEYAPAAPSGPSTCRNSNARHEPIGALDMGGSSTQIVYMANDPKERVKDSDGGGERTCKIDESDYAALDGGDFFSTSYLSYGVDQFRERLWNTLIRERQNCDAGLENSCLNKSISNPCANMGYEQEWQGFTLIGTGDTDDCVRHVRRLIPHADEPRDDHDYEIDRRVGGIVHPPVRRGTKFMAMSLYFFTLDSLRVYSNDLVLHASWPTPSLDELHNALHGLCGRKWAGDLANDHDAHPFTRPQVLPHRCLESVYLVTLLRDGFGFDASARDITFAFTVDGNEVEWTLGMAIATRNSQDTSGENDEDIVDVKGNQIDNVDAEGSSADEINNENDDGNATCQNQVCSDQNRHTIQQTKLSTQYFAEWIWPPPYNQQ